MIIHAKFEDNDRNDVILKCSLTYYTSFENVCFYGPNHYWIIVAEFIFSIFSCLIDLLHINFHHIPKHSCTKFLYVQFCFQLHVIEILTLHRQKYNRFMTHVNISKLRIIIEMVWLTSKPIISLITNIFQNTSIKNYK